MSTVLRKADDDHDSGTESDDESAEIEIEELQKYMEHTIKLQEGTTVTPPGSGGRRDTHKHSLHYRPRSTASRGSPRRTDVESPLPLDSALPSDSDHNFDHHSSEEELEVINSSVVCRTGGASLSTAAAVAAAQYPEKRKWSQANRHGGGFSGDTSSDDEVRDIACVPAPVEFRASPPAHVHRPNRSLSPPPKVFHSAHIPAFEVCSVSPRKRHRQTPYSSGQPAASAGGGMSSAQLQRPCLDFEKMQQIRVKLL